MLSKPGPEYITDSYGQKYQLHIILESEEQLLVDIYDTQIVGYANCIIQHSNELSLADIRIFDQAIVFRSTFQRIWVAAIQRAPSRTKNYQRRGLGTQLLQWVIEYARARALTRIVGDVVEQDLAQNPNLCQWYQKHGFSITEPPPGAPKGIAKQIIMHIRRVDK